MLPESRSKYNEQRLFDVESFDEWRKTWVGMPAFEVKKVRPIHEVTIRFYSPQAVREFSKLLDQTVTMQTHALRFPKRERIKPSFFRWVDDGEDDCGS